MEKELKFPNATAREWYKKGLLEGLNALWSLHDDMEGHLIRLERNFTDKELREILARDDS